MADLDFLDTKHRQYVRFRDAWLRSERRAYGGDLVRSDLWQFKGESTEFYRARQEAVSYSNFMQVHASKVTGQLRHLAAPAANSERFSMGVLGKVRPREEVRESDADPAEVIYFNVDGTGGEGSEWPVFFDSVDEAAQHTGHRVLLCEAKRKPAPRARSAEEEEPEFSLPDFRAGFRPYLAHLSPLDMPFWVMQSGTFQVVILRVAFETGRVNAEGAWVEPGTPANQTVSDPDSMAGKGYYLLVRRGCRLLGAKYERGGYWLFGADKELVRTGSWNATNGEIPLWLHFGEKSGGTHEVPALSRSATDGLGRISVSLMNILSAWDFDTWDAGASYRFFLNATKPVMRDLAEQWEAGSLNLGVPPAFDENTGNSQPVTIADSSSSAVAAGVFSQLVQAKYDQAREASFQAITSLPGSSGISKEMGFAEVKAPYLATRASYRQQSEQAAIRFLEMRGRGLSPEGFCAYKTTELSLEPVVDEIERTFDLMRKQAMRSRSMEPALMLQAVKERLGKVPQLVGPDGQPIQDAASAEATVLREFSESVDRAVTQRAQADALSGIFGG